MDAYEAIVGKRDIRHYTDVEVTDEDVNKILQAGRMAGSAKNAESLRILVARDQVVKDALAKGGDYASWIGSAPIVIGFTCPSEELRLFDVGRQAQNMMIAANAVGLATCPVTLHHSDVVAAAVGLPADWVMPMVITLGWPDPHRPASPLKRKRIELTELVRFDRWS